MSARRAQSAPPRGKRPSLEDVLAAGLARLRLQPSDVGMRGPHGSRLPGQPQQPRGLGLQRPSNLSNWKLLQFMDKEQEGPTTPRRVDVLQDLDATGELQKLYDEDMEQQDWDKWLRDQLDRHDASDGRILPTPDEMVDAQRRRRAELRRIWSQNRRPPLPQSSDPRVTRNQGIKHINEAAQIVMLDWFEVNKDKNPLVSEEQIGVWERELNLTSEQIRNYMAKLRMRSKQADFELLAQQTPAPAPPPAEAEAADPSPFPSLLAPYESLNRSTE